MADFSIITLGHSHYPLPWAALKLQYPARRLRDGGYETGISEAQLKGAPSFSDDSWQDRNWETRTHQHYNVRPYW